MRADRVTVALAQAYSPLTLAAAIEGAHQWCLRAAAAGAQLVVFPESWIPGYPVWLDVCRDVAIWGNDTVEELYAHTWENSLDIRSTEGAKLREIAADTNITMVMGAMERVAPAGHYGGGANHRPQAPAPVSEERARSHGGVSTIYNSLFVFGNDGRVMNHHRKLVPTHGERLLWGSGDVEGLRVVPFAGTRLGGLICWEHWIPLARQALHEQGEEVHCALWPTVTDRHLIASRHYAFEGRCHVLACGSLLRASDLPSDLEPHPELVRSPDQFLLRGGSCIIGPDSELLTEQVFDAEHLVVAELRLSGGVRRSLTMDVTGHYSGGDALWLGVRRSGSRPVSD